MKTAVISGTFPNNKDTSSYIDFKYELESKDISKVIYAIQSISAMRIDNMEFATQNPFKLTIGSSDVSIEYSRIKVSKDGLVQLVTKTRADKTSMIIYALIDPEDFSEEISLYLHEFLSQTKIQ